VFAGPLECSYVLDDAWHAHQRLEFENDLIARTCSRLARCLLASSSAERGDF
jgi:hypothetical protein